MQGRSYANRGFAARLPRALGKRRSAEGTISVPWNLNAFIQRATARFTYSPGPTGVRPLKLPPMPLERG